MEVMQMIKSSCLVNKLHFIVMQIMAKAHPTIYQEF